MKEQIFENFPVLETKRIVLRQMKESDIDIVYGFNSCNDALKYIIREPFKRQEEALAKLKFFLSKINDKTAFWWVFTLKETGKNIGYGGLFDISIESSRAEIGYGLTKEYWNKGYISEILGAILEFGVSKAKFHKIYGIVIPENVASIRLLEKYNFKKEAHLKEHSYTNGEYLDETIYSLISK